MHLVYNIALLPLRVVAAIVATFGGRTPAARAEWAERRLRRLPEAPPGAIWLHGASLGEARLVTALARALLAARPGITIAASALTSAGREALPATAAARFFLPLDVPSWQGRLLDALRPSALVLVETEMWPNLVREAEARGVPVCLVNARLAPERMRRYRFLRSLYAPLLSRVSRIGAQSAEDAGRFSELGGQAGSIEVTGNLKYDLPAPTLTRAAMRAELGIDPDRPVVAAGSTGEGEDLLVLEAFERLRSHRPEALLILAPRHASRFDDAERLAASRGRSVARLSRSQAGLPRGTEVLLVDVLGRLASLYAAADAAFVGGSLVPVGGHNVLEPAACGVPVLFGPHTHHVEAPARELERTGGALRVADTAALAEGWISLLDNSARREAFAAAAANVVAANRGALEKTTALILEVARLGVASGAR